VLADRARYRRVLDAAKRPELLDALQKGTPLATAVDFVGIDPDLVSDLAERPEIRKAIAARRIELQGKLMSPEKGERDGALAELERQHGWRRPPSITVEDRFADVIERFREVAAPEAYAVLHGILVQSGETAAERRRKRRDSK